MNGVVLAKPNNGKCLKKTAMTFAYDLMKLSGATLEYDLHICILAT